MVGETGRIGVAFEQGMEEFDVTADGVAVAGEAGIGGEDEASMGAAFALPASGDHGEVGDVVGEQRPLVAGGKGQEPVVFFGFPSMGDRATQSDSQPGLRSPAGLAEVLRDVGEHPGRAEHPGMLGIDTLAEVLEVHVGILGAGAELGDGAGGQGQPGGAQLVSDSAHVDVRQLGGEQVVERAVGAD